MDKTPTPLIEGIDSQTMQGGSYIRQPDGAVARVEGVNLTDEEKMAAPALIKAHGEAMAAAAAADQAKPVEPAKPAEPAKVAPPAAGGSAPRRGAPE